MNVSEVNLDTVVNRDIEVNHVTEVNHDIVVNLIGGVQAKHVTEVSRVIVVNHTIEANRPHRVVTRSDAASRSIEVDRDIEANLLPAAAVRNAADLVPEVCPRVVALVIGHVREIGRITDHLIEHLVVIENAGKNL